MKKRKRASEEIMAGCSSSEVSDTDDIVGIKEMDTEGHVTELAGSRTVADESEDPNEGSNKAQFRIDTNIEVLEEEMPALMEDVSGADDIVEIMEMTTEGHETELAGTSTVAGESEDTNEGSKKAQYTNIEVLVEEIAALMKEVSGADESEDTNDGSKKSQFGINTNIEVLEEEMPALMEEDFSDRIRQNRFTKLIQEYGQSDAEWEALNGLRVRAVKIGTELSHKLADFMISMLGKEETFKELKLSLKSVEGYEKSIVLRKIVAVLEMMDKNLEELKKYLEGEMLITKETESDAGYNQTTIDEFLHKFLHIILHLEAITSHPGLLSVALRDAEQSKLEDGLKQCEIELEGMSLKINEFKVTFSFIMELNNLKSNELWNSMSSVVNDMWKDMDGEDEAENEVS
ncbi:hypothetical protein O6P43_012889 [Quillaja saponaria]|uniref:Uncharacterized protein n=1 Tax=Quillaja saponaria TaxID=32244 RepID=A0AAD7M520_QUISA|nr:hypothetical protein O6P43_012889 [Quillaja saponaria]